MSSPGKPAPAAVVTGASSGLGAIFAQRLGERGQLVLAGRDPGQLEEFRQRVTGGCPPRHWASQASPRCATMPA